MSNVHFSPYRVLSKYHAIEEYFEGMDDGRILLVSATIIPFFDHQLLVAEGEMLAIAKISELMNAMYPGKMLQPILSTYIDFAADQKVAEGVLLQDCHMILLGGPASNRLTREVLAKEAESQHLECFFELGELRVPGFSEPSVKLENIKVNGTTIPYTSQDTGWGFRCRNPFNPERYVYVFAGVETFGTCGAASAALTVPRIGEIWMERGRPDIFEYAVRVERTHQPYITLSWSLFYPEKSEPYRNPWAWEPFHHLVHAIQRRGRGSPKAGLVFLAISTLVAVIAGRLLQSRLFGERFSMLGELVKYVMAAAIGLVAVGVLSMISFFWEKNRPIGRATN